MMDNRSEYSDDMEDQWGWIRWRGAVASAMRGRKGQAFLRELLAALDAMPEKRLITEELHHEGSYCALGVVGQARGMDLDTINPDDHYAVASSFKISNALAREIMFVNDDGRFTPEERYSMVREWAVRNIRPEGVE